MIPSLNILWNILCVLSYNDMSWFTWSHQHFSGKEGVSLDYEEKIDDVAMFQVEIRSVDEKDKKTRLFLD
jgi:hypothetical protein